MSSRLYFWERRQPYDGRLQNTVISDLDRQTHMCSRGDFMDKILGKFDVNYRDIMNSLKESGAYRSGHWKGLSMVPKGEEIRYNVSLAKSCNAITGHQVVVEAANNLGGNGCVNGIWMHRSDLLTESTVTNYPQAMPGVSYVVCRRRKGTTKDAFRDGIEEYANMREHASRLYAECGATPSGGPSKGKLGCQLELDLSNERLEPDTPSSSKEELKLFKVQWLWTIIPVEVAPGNVIEKAHILQLGMYLRSILREQQDRRFALGLLFVDDKLFLFYCDPSGLLCTISDPIYIHKDPLELIQVISSFALMSPSKLGWDTTMKLVTSKIACPRYSFDSEIPLDPLPHDADDINWQITLGTSVYRTVECIYKPKDEVMIGKATLVWKAVCVEEVTVELPHAQQDKFVTIKQTWVPIQEGVLNEFDLYKIGYDDYEELISHHVVQEGTNTVVDFRRGLAGSKESDIKNYFSEAPFEFPPEITVVSWLWKEDSFDTTPRAQCRLVMPFQYQTVHNFGSLRELLTAFFEAICDYEKLHNRGICHRNVCPRNIIVDPASGKGRLISLDYAEYDKRYKPKTIAEIVHDDARKLLSMAFMFQEDLPRNLVIEDELTWALVSSPNVQDSDTAFEMLVNLRKDRIAELEKAGKPIHFSPTFGFADLGLPISAQTLVPPNFQPWSGINFIRTGAMSFMSHDLIWDFLKQEIVYSAIHDMDSFLQTLVHICLTREGPRGRTIKDLHDNRDTYSALRLRQSDDVENAVRQLFTDDPRDTRERKKYFLESQEERDRICDLFNVYFLPLKPLIDTWARILDRVFNRRRPEESTLYTFYPIQAVKGAISETIEKLSSPAIQSSSSRLPGT